MSKQDGQLWTKMAFKFDPSNYLFLVSPAMVTGMSFEISSIYMYLTGDQHNMFCEKC